jgi:4'-phosphopantetheinyl transferase EntD
MKYGRVASDVWQDLVPAVVCVNAGPFLRDPLRLTPSEERSAGGIALERSLELQNGRTYAKRALAMLGIHNVDIPIGSDRSPVWPNGIIGSIAHIVGEADGHVAVAVARTKDISAIGIDIEHEKVIHPRLWKSFLTEREFKRIIALPPYIRMVEAQITWSAKEAVAKAARRSIEPTQLEIRHNEAHDAFLAILPPNGPSGPSEVWRGQAAISHGLVFASVVRAVNEQDAGAHQHNL